MFRSWPTPRRCGSDPPAARFPLVGFKDMLVESLSWWVRGYEPARVPDWVQAVPEAWGSAVLLANQPCTSTTTSIAAVPGLRILIGPSVATGTTTRSLRRTL